MRHVEVAVACLGWVLAWAFYALWMAERRRNRPPPKWCCGAIGEGHAPDCNGGM